MITIAPAIIPQSEVHLKKSLDSVSACARSLQIDIVDGRFVSAVSWPYLGDCVIADIQPLIAPYEVEFDLMIEHPEDVCEAYVNIGASRIVVHLESVSDIERIVAIKKIRDFKLGISVNNDTDIAQLMKYRPYADYIQCMGIAHIGSQGNPFDERVISRVVFLREMYPELEISVDGSVTMDTLPRLIEAGATRFAVGSAIFSADNPCEIYQKFLHGGTA
ncbi:MAG TPA: hypothetical protein VFV22_02340 [Candidatus Paceibacterota bacterium]|nr:hypothetical protein [Candidatus Paceibacterota bacterium]